MAYLSNPFLVFLANVDGEHSSFLARNMARNWYVSPPAMLVWWMPWFPSTRPCFEHLTPRAEGGVRVSEKTLEDRQQAEKTTALCALRSTISTIERVHTSS